MIYKTFRCDLCGTEFTPDEANANVRRLRWSGASIELLRAGDPTASEVVICLACLKSLKKAAE